MFQHEIAAEYCNYTKEYQINAFDALAKRLLIHCIVEKCCNAALSIQTGKVVFFYNKECLKWDNCDAEEIVNFTHKTIKQCTKVLPITWYCSSKTLQYYLNIIDKQQGSSFLLQISNKMKTSYTFDRALKYIQKNKLTFLNDHYFTCLKTRCLLLNT
jgi:hypothetical protein